MHSSGIASHITESTTASSGARFRFNFTRLAEALAVLVSLTAWAGSAQAQTLQPTPDTAAQARALYDQRLQACDAALPRPEYEACVRAAGVALDRTGLAASGTKAVESTDGRAKIYVAPGTAPPPGGSAELAPKTVTSRDGRATLLVPTDSTLRSTRVHP